MDRLIQLTKKQKQAWDILMDDKTRVLVYGGAACGGKSWLLCVWLMCMALGHPGTRWFMAREELKALRSSTYETFQRVSAKYGFNDTWSFNGQYNFIRFNNGSKIQLLDLKYRPSDELFESLGSHEYTGGAIDEVTEVHFRAFEVLQVRVDRCLNKEYGLFPKILCTCNPNKFHWAYSRFYKPHKNGTLDPEYAFIQSLVTDNAFATKRNVAGLERLSDESEKQRLRYGNWDYEGDPTQLIEQAWIEQCFHSPRQPGKRSLGADVGRYKDPSTIAKMDGNSVYFLKRYQHDNNTAKFGEIIMNEAIFERIDADRCAVDGAGIGAGAVDYCRLNNFKVKDIQSGSKMAETHATGLYRFANLKSQMWWALREALRNEEIFFDFTFEREDVQKLMEDLTAVSYETKGDKVIQVEGKDELRNRIGRSTDFGDALVYANWIRVLQDFKSNNEPNDTEFFSVCDTWTAVFS